MAKLRYCIGIFKSDTPEEMVKYSQIKSSMMNTDTIAEIKEETTFTKEGTYVIALHWTETGSSDEDRKILRDLVKEGV